MGNFTSAFYFDFWRSQAIAPAPARNIRKAYTAATAMNWNMVLLLLLGARGGPLVLSFFPTQLTGQQVSTTIHRSQLYPQCISVCGGTIYGSPSLLSAYGDEGVCHPTKRLLNGSSNSIFIVPTQFVTFLTVMAFRHTVDGEWSVD